MRRYVFLVVLAACSSGATSDDAARGGGGAVASSTVAPPTADVADTQVEAGREVLRLPLSLYVVSDADESGLGSLRTDAEVEAIVADIAPIWEQADVVFEPIRISEIDMPAEVLGDIVLAGSADAFFDQAGVAFDLPGAGIINGFYVAEAAGVNGFTPAGSRLFFVVDQPTVNDERVSSHEIGHILGLHHDLDDTGRLMFSGTNGELLTDEEQTVARYAAKGLLDGVR